MMELEANHAKVVVSMTEAASVEREDHLKTQTELRSRVEDIEAQKVVLAEAVKESEARIAKSKAMTEEMEALQARLTTLSEEKEENANKVSELEIEILELKETQETLEDVRDALQGRVDELLRKLADAADAAKVAADAASKENAEHSEKVKELSAKHKQDLEHSAAQVVEIATSLDQLKAEYDKVVDDLENMKKDVASQEEQHNLKLDEVEKAHADVVAGLSSQLAEVSKTLNVSRNGVSVIYAHSLLSRSKNPSMTTRSTISMQNMPSFLKRLSHVLGWVLWRARFILQVTHFVIFRRGRLMKPIASNSRRFVIHRIRPFNNFRKPMQIL
jgi:chromosome segregation ATPase